MEVKLAETAGFCFGVKRAVNMLQNEVHKESSKPIYTFGAIIHNANVMEEFARQGVKTIREKEEIADIKDSRLVIRAHGVEKEIYDIAGENDVEIIDATCPFVARIHKIASGASENGRTIVVAGDKDHPEVRGIIGWIKSDYFVVKDENEADMLPEFGTKPVTVVFQTTFEVQKCKYIVEILNKKGYDINVIDTVCNATAERQREAAEIAAEVDAMIVIGDRSSANSNRLYEICRSCCKDTYFIQKQIDLLETDLQSCISVGITAGASTPDNIIQEVFLNVRGKEL